MGGGSSLVRLGKADVWAYVVETAEGLRLRLSLDEWEGTGLHPGQRVPVRRAGRWDESLFLAEAVAVPPLVWLVMLGRAGAG